MIRLLTPWPALLADIGEKVLIVADLHIGLEYELSKAGVNIPYQTERIQGELLALCREHKPDRLVIAGDVKHGVPVTSFQEKRELPTLFEVLLREVPRIDVTRGNHDGSIQDLATKGVEIHGSKGIILGEDLKRARQALLDAQVALQTDAAAARERELRDKIAAFERPDGG